ncbi:MAG TPA: C4-type zinc ribbon domain-containing protein [Pyrinomonadaceae bacterium]|nr:C4-type zinc ribbon domain-containing protein [Pyrinomonadaceae bacterium]
MKAELEKLVELQKTDTKIRNLKKAIDTADERRAAIEQEFETHASSIREIQQRRDTAQAERGKLETYLELQKSYQAKNDRNLKHAQNHKEYETAMRDLDVVQKQIATLETQIVEKMTVIEAIEAELAERAEEINSLESNRADALSKFDAEVGKNKKEFASETAKRKEVFVTLPDRLAAVYNRLAQRGRDGIAVAEVIGGACSACFMSLRPQRQADVRRGDEIITCENCTRILYTAAKPAQSEATAS